MKDIRKDQEDEDVRFTTSLAGLAVSLFLAVLGLYLLESLSAESKWRIVCSRAGWTVCRST